MDDARAALRRLLRDRFAAERDAGFPRLRRIPSTRVFRFLDGLAALAAGEQAEVAESLVDRAAEHFVLSSAPRSGRTPCPGNAAYQRFAETTAWRGFGGGLRYTPVHLLADIAKQHPGGLEDWCRMMRFSGLELQPPEGLLSGASALVPVRRPVLRKLVHSALQELFAPQATDIGEGIWHYHGELAGAALALEISYGRNRSEPDLRYAVTVRGRGWTVGPRTSFEALFGAGIGWWDYLTEENVERSIALLPELLQDLTHLPERLPEV